ncbi:MAG: manganese efflux pump, partial [Firmicutes bacterium]|nr:manganese efflux pump [Bacillota bacterium]
EVADLDKSKVLSKKEACLLAAALGLDALAVGVGAGMINQSVYFYLIAIGLSLVMDIVLLGLGTFAGNKVAKKTKINLSWVGGLILIGVALTNIIF